MGSLADAFNVLKSGTLWHNTLLASPKHPCKGFADANPGEAASIDSYVAALDSGQRPDPPVLTTATGRGLVGMLAALTPASAPPPPAPSAQPLWDGTIPSGQWEYVGVNKTGPPISERVSQLAETPPLMRIITKAGDQYFSTTGWRTLGRQFDPAKRTLPAGYESSYVLLWRVPVGWPFDGKVWAAPMEMHQTKAPYVTITGPAPFNMGVGASAIGLRVSGGKDGARVDAVATNVCSGYRQGVKQVSVIRYKHDPADGAFEFWHAEAGQQLKPIIQKDHIGTSYEQTTSYPEFGIYRDQVGRADMTLDLAVREFAQLADAVAWGNQLAT